MDDRAPLLHQTAGLAADFLNSLPDRPVRGPATRADLLANADLCLELEHDRG